MTLQRRDAFCMRQLSSCFIGYWIEMNCVQQLHRHIRWTISSAVGQTQWFSSMRLSGWFAYINDDEVAFDHADVRLYNVCGLNTRGVFCLSVSHRPTMYAYYDRRRSFVMSEQLFSAVVVLQGEIRDVMVPLFWSVNNIPLKACHSVGLLAW